MITREERLEIAARIAEHVTKPEHEGRIGGTAGLVTAPQAWYLDAENRANSATVVGFYADNVIFATVGQGRVFSVNGSLVWLDYEEALCAAAEQQKKQLEAAQANYLSTCAAATKFLKEFRDKKRAERDKPKPKAAPVPPVPVEA